MRLATISNACPRCCLLYTSSSGTSGSVINPYYGTGQYNYAPKHNPMAFFTDTYNQNVYELSQLFTDLNNNAVGRYNWITPNQYDDCLLYTSLQSSARVMLV